MTKPSATPVTIGELRAAAGGIVGRHDLDWYRHLLGLSADELERQRARLSGKREGPHCPTCSCGMAADEPVKP